ncbi:BppU family phage baseplate upper protein [Clostridium butyricum]|uniref:BppU family phage baseplate upper protein n=1 Tax=Clostridium butyricum TaxID=1492 RepID=UPI00346639A0
MERNINIKIDIDDRAPTSYNDLIKVGDSINLTIDLLSKGESVDLKDSSVELFLKKEDGTKVEQEVIIGDSKVSCTPLNIQSTTVVGQVCGELVVESSGNQVTSSTFIFNVEGSTSSEILEESKDDIATIKSLKNTIVNVNSVVEKYKTNIEAIAGTSESIEALAQIKIYAESAVTEIETVVNTGNTLKTSLESENTRAENNIQELNNLGSESIKTHINNTDIHVAASDKTKWDSYEQLISDNTSHLNENTNGINTINKFLDKPITIHDDNTDMNTITKTGLHRVHTTVNAPYNGDMDYVVDVFNPFEDQSIIVQIIYSLWTHDQHIYMRTLNNSVWTTVQMSSNKSKEIPLPLNSPYLEYAGVSAGYSNKIIKKDNGTIIISFCVKKADGSRIAANELIGIANIPVGYRIKACFGSASIWGGFKPSLAYIDGSHTLTCRAVEEGEAIVGNIIGEAI